MKKLMTLLLVGMMAFGAQVATAADYDGDKGKGKKKGKPSFVDEKHRAHAEWKREKEYEKARKKHNKGYEDDKDRWEDRRDEDRRNDGRWERRREDESREQRRERERWENREEQNRNRGLGDILREGARNGDIGRPSTGNPRKN